MADYDEDDIDELADLYGVEPEEVEALLEVMPPNQVDHYLNGDFDSIWNVDVVRYTKKGNPVPDSDQMLELADYFDIDISDLYDMYYGYPPGSRGR